MAAPASDWLRHFRLLWNCWTKFNKTCQEARFQRRLPSLCFFGPIRKKQDGRPSLSSAETFSNSPLKPHNGIQWNLTGSKILKSHTKFCVFRADRKKRCNNVCACWAPRGRHNINPLGTPVDTPIPHFHVGCLESSGGNTQVTWQDGRPGLWSTEAFSTCPLKPLNGIQRNLKGSKISTFSTKFVFFGPVGKTRWPPQSLIGWLCFWGISVNKNVCPGRPVKKVAHCTQVHYMWPCGSLVSSPVPKVQVSYCHSALSVCQYLLAEQQNDRDVIKAKTLCSVYSCMLYDYNTEYTTRTRQIIWWWKR